MQDVVAECSEAAAALRLRMPLSVSTRVGETASVYVRLVHAARDPQHCIPLTPSLEVLHPETLAINICTPALLQPRYIYFPFHLELYRRCTSRVTHDCAAGQAEPWAVESSRVVTSHLSGGMGLAQAVQNYRRLMRRALLYTAAGTAAGVAIYFSYRWVQGRTSESRAAESTAAAATAGTESAP